MKKLLVLCLSIFSCLTAIVAQVKIGAAGTPNINAVLELDGGTNKGLLLPRISSVQMVALNTAPDGLVIYNNTDGFVYVRKNAAWQKISDATNGGGFSLPFTGSVGTVGGAAFSVTQTGALGDAAVFSHSNGGLALVTQAGNVKFNTTSGNTGIGIPGGIAENPTLGRLVVRGSVGATVAVFDDKNTGISLQSNLPSIGFNEYYSGGSKYISNGFGGKMAFLTGSGDLGWYVSNASGTANAAAALSQSFGISRGGSMVIQGADAGYIFKDRTTTNYAGWNWYADAGKASLYRYNIGGNTITIDSTGSIGLQGNTNPTAPLTMASALGNKIDFYYVNASSRYGFGLQGGLMQMYSGGAADDIAFGYGSSTVFTERMRIKGNGNVGIGTASPTRPLSFPAAEGKKISLYPGATGDVGLSVAPNEFRIYSDNSNAVITMGYDNFNNGFKEAFRVNPWGSTITTNPVTLAANTENAMYFKTTNYFAGAVKTIGVDNTHARMGFFGYASTNAASLKEYLSISDAGYIGIGTTIPKRPLSFPAVLEKKISLYPGTTGDAGFGVFGNELRMNSDNVNADITFGFDNFNSGFTERMRVKGNGNVGIGTNDPGFLLDVGGRIRLRQFDASNTAGIWFDGTTQATRSFIGTNNNNTMGFYCANAGWNFLMDVTDGAIMIGTTQKASGYKVNVGGKIIAEEMRVQLRGAWPDYVFENGYKKLTLDELENFVAQHKHLPNVPSAAQIENDGQQLGEVQRKLLEKVEELTLYIIEQDKRIKTLEQNNAVKQ